jgi:hypothetical protein
LSGYVDLRAGGEDAHARRDAGGAVYAGGLCSGALDDRQDGAGSIDVAIPQPGEYPPTGPLPTGIVFSSPGCWRVSASLGSAQLSVTMLVN